MIADLQPPFASVPPENMQITGDGDAIFEDNNGEQGFYGWEQQSDDNGTEQEDQGPAPFTVDHDEKFKKFLRTVLGIRTKEWPTVRTLGQALPRYQAAQSAVSKLEAWGWRRAQGGFRVPPHDPIDVSKSK